MSATPEQLAAAIAALEAQRHLLGDAVVAAAVAPLQRELAALQACDRQLQQLKQVSVLFVDVVGSTAMGQQLEPEDIHAVMDGALEQFTTVVQRHGGRVLQYTGDGMLAAFGSEQVHEDDVENAVRAGLQIIQDAQAHAPAVRARQGIPDFNVRVGVHTGTVLLGGGVDADGSIRGSTVNVAARMEQTAPPGRLRISHDSYQHVRGLFDVVEQPPLSVKGVEQPLRSYLVEKAKPRAFRVPTRGIEGVPTHMIGRQAEFESVCEAFVDVVTENHLRAITIIADAGLGKSRLLAEFQLIADPKTCWLLLGRAHPRSALHPYGLLRDMLVRQFQISDAEPAEAARRKFVDGLAPLIRPGEESAVHLLGHLIGLDFSASPHVEAVLASEQAFREQAFTAARLYLRRLADVLPVVIALDDFHWADTGTLDFVRNLLGSAPDVPLLCVMTTRPVLLEQQPDWLTGVGRHEPLILRPLDGNLSQQLASELLQRLDQVPAALSSLITSGAEGNPFYMEELVKMLIDDGVIEVDGDVWRVSPDRLVKAHVPKTLAGVLQARIDSLTPPERQALQHAAVVGHVFWDRAVASIDPGAVDQLPVLLRKRLIVQHDALAFDDASEFAFQHNLLHQVAYDGVLKAPRQAAHARVGEFWSTRAEVARLQDVTPASCRALAEAQFHRCRADAKGYVDWFENQFGFYLDAYASQVLRPLAEQLIGVCEEQFGEESAETARALTNLARVILQLGGVERAEPLLRRSMAIQEKVLPPTHPDTARTLAVFGGYHSGRGDLAAAEPYFRRALDMRLALLGAEHPLTLGMLDHLAKVTLELGRLDEAEQLSRDVLAAKERALGTDDPGTAFAMMAVGEVLIKRGKYEDALPLIRHALDVQQRQLAADNPDIALSMWHLAEATRALGRFDESESLARDALQRWEAKFGPDHEWTAWGLIGLAQTRLMQEDAAEAADLADRAAKVVERVYGPTHAVLASTLYLSGRALVQLGETDRAVLALTRALAIQMQDGSSPGAADQTLELLDRTRSEVAQR